MVAPSSSFSNLKILPRSKSSSFFSGNHYTTPPITSFQISESCQQIKRVMAIPRKETKMLCGKKKVNRKEILEKKKAIDQLIKAASTQKDHLLSFPAFRNYNRNGLSVHLESGCGDELSASVKRYIQNLLKINMEGPYGSEWPIEEKVKRREMVSPEARYIFVREFPSGTVNEMPKLVGKETTNHAESKNSLAGYIHYRFTLEEEIPVLYVYELQLEPRIQGKGLGKFLMQLIELIAHKSRMSAVLLTVQKANLLAMNFYLNKLRLELRQVMKFFVKCLILTLKLHLRAKSIPV